MTKPVHTLNEQAQLENALELMARAGTRRLVVTGNDNELVGLLSLDDVLDVVVGQMAAIGDLLEQQQPRIPT